MSPGGGRTPLSERLQVVARSGGLKHAWAIVGRCEEAPAAHVFSFDHVRREGHRLM